MYLELATSKRFMEAYGSASLGLKQLAEGVIHDFVRRYESNPRTILQHYDKLAGFPETVLEFKPTGGHRLLADLTNNQLTLLEFGGHEIVGLYTRQKYAYDLQFFACAPDQFWPGSGSFFRRQINSDALTVHYKEELSSEWLYFLETQQQQVDRKIRNHLFKMIDQRRNSPPFFILGGPGTGKSCILLNLLHFFHDIADVGIVISDELTEFVEHATGADISPYRVDLRSSASRVDILLVDDPSSIEQLEAALIMKQQGTVKGLVIAFDPLQLHDALADDQYQAIVDKYSVQPYELHVCYRQKENVGKSTKHVIDIVAKSTPFLAIRKKRDFRMQHSLLTKMSNELRFVNPAGYVQYCVEATVEDIQYEVNRILRERWLMWDFCPGLLIVEGLQDGYILSDAANHTLQPLVQLNYVKRASLRHIERLKGLEFQHVFIFMDIASFRDIQNGFSGSGRNVYNDRRLLRIPFSRAKDSLVVFAL